MKMYTLTFYLKDKNNNIIATLHSVSEIAALFNDPAILNCTNEIELNMYLMEHHFRVTIKDVTFGFVGLNISNTDLTITFTYQQL